jgi:predicted SAM-dependent methyltransferase
MTPESKKELALELEAKEMKEALKWVQTGGWFHCSEYGATCECPGDIRMVDKEHTVEAVILPAQKRKNASVLCDTSSFGDQDVRPHYPKVCECTNAAKGKNFHLRKRLTSKSYLQEVWIFLLRLLGRTSLLPAGTGDRNYHGMENWSARHVKGTQPVILEHFWIEMFVHKVVSVHAPWGRCLEWGNPQWPGSGFYYALMVPGCTHNVDIQYDAVYHGHKAMGTIENNVVYSDIEHLPNILTSTWIPGQGDSRMNVIFATQVFEHLTYPISAAKALFNSLLPGGALVFTAPQQAQFHQVPHDYYRYTKEGALHVLLTAGFCVPAWGFVGGGDFIFDIGRDAGLQGQDFTHEEIAGAFQEGYWKVSDSAITIHAIAFKPPHNACSESMR